MKRSFGVVIIVMRILQYVLYSSSAVSVQEQKVAQVGMARASLDLSIWHLLYCSLFLFLMWVGCCSFSGKCFPYFIVYRAISLI